MKKLLVGLCLFLFGLFAPSAHASCTHAVEKGDNLSEVARVYGKPLSEVKRMNGWVKIRSSFNFLKVGDKIVVDENCSEYKVRPRENLSTIARGNGILLKAIKKANPQIGKRRRGFNFIRPGQYVNIPQASIAHAKKTVAESAPPKVPTLYMGKTSTGYVDNDVLGVAPAAREQNLLPAGAVVLHTEKVENKEDKQGKPSLFLAGYISSLYAYPSVRYGGIGLLLLSGIIVWFFKRKNMGIPIKGNYTHVFRKGRRNRLAVPRL